MSQLLQTPATPANAPIECPECAARLNARPTLAGEVLDCTDCGAELEVVSLQPLLVQLAPQAEEDWGE
jgi:alpha-aminoadipate carrier protein LysW